MTRYAYSSALDVHAGQRVQAGEVIAQAGSSGRSNGSHVHFEEWRDGLALTRWCATSAELPARTA